MQNNMLPSYFISHGGGPWPYMQQESGSTYAKLQAALQDIPKQLGQTPSAILMISAHWEEAEFTLMSGAAPGMLYDYSGFPQHTYQIEYPAPGAPQLAQRVAQLISASDTPVQFDTQRGFDHGAFVPLAVMYPRANIPVVQLSLRRGLDPAQHLALGRALAPLRSEGVLIIGSGLSYHNLRQFGPGARQPSLLFDQWLQQSLLQSSPSARSQALLAWEQAPAARLAHPRAEHLLPLMVAVGAAEQEAGICFHHEEDFFGQITVSGFRFG